MQRDQSLIPGPQERWNCQAAGRISYYCFLPRSEFTAAGMGFFCVSPVGRPVWSFFFAFHFPGCRFGIRRIWPAPPVSSVGVSRYTRASCAPGLLVCLWGRSKFQGSSAKWRNAGIRLVEGLASYIQAGLISWIPSLR